jgi:hypothetical protein
MIAISDRNRAMVPEAELNTKLCFFFRPLQFYDSEQQGVLFVLITKRDNAILSGMKKADHV